jgi:hypothetical protein
VDVRPAGSSYDAAVELAPGVAGTDALEALGRVLAHPALPAVLDATVGRNAARVRWKRTGDVARAELTLAAGADPEARRALKSLAGAEAVVAQVTAARGQLLVATGVDAAARLQTLAGDRAAAPAAEVAALAAGAKEAAGFAYVDLLAFVRTGLAAASGTDAGAAQVSAMMGALPAFASLKLPVAVMWTGGERFSGDLRVPIETMTGAATAVRPFVGLGGLGGPPP